jgi:hypothetical protein
MEGLIVTLSDSGLLSVAYLGTEAPTSGVQQTAGDAKDQSYEHMSVENQRLLARIRNYENEKQVEPQDMLLLNAQLSSVVESSGEYVEDPRNQLVRNTQGRLIRMKLKLTLSFKAIPGSKGPLLKNVQLSLSQLPHNVYTEEASWKYAELDFRGQPTPPVVAVYLYATTEGAPVSDLVTATATYTQVVEKGTECQSVMRTQVASVRLPLAFFVQIHPGNQQDFAQREADVKLNLVLNRTVPSLQSLFEDAVESLQAREVAS